MIRIICACGARPNFVKIAPLRRAFEEASNFDVLCFLSAEVTQTKAFGNV